MKRTAAVALAITVASLIVAGGPTGCRDHADRPGKARQAKATNQSARSAAVVPSEDPQRLRTKLEAVYTKYLQAIFDQREQKTGSHVGQRRLII